MNIRWLALATVLLLGAATAVRAFPPGAESLLAGKVRSPLPPVVIRSVSLTSTTFTTGTSGTVGTLSATLSSGSPTGSFTLTNSGVDHSGISCQNYSSYLSVSGTSLNFNNTAPVQSYPGTCITYTQSSLSNSPYTQSFNLTGNASGSPTPPAFTSPSASGFTAVAMNLDFTGATTSSGNNGTTYNPSDVSSPSSWLNCTGGQTNPLFYAVGPYSNRSPCSDYFITTDSTIGKTVFALQWTATDMANGANTTQMDTGIPNTSGGNVMPPTGVREIVFRSPVDPTTAFSSVSSSCSSSGSGCPNYTGWWSIQHPCCSGVEQDFLELWYPFTQPYGLSLDWQNGSLDRGIAQDNTWSDAPGYNIMQYHTYTIRGTGDGNSSGSNNNATCGWLDGVSMGCTQGSQTAPWYSQQTELILEVGPQGTGASPYPLTVGHSSIIYVQRITDYECPNWATSHFCWGTVLGSCSIGQTTPC